MVVITETVHPKSLDFRNQRKVVLLRDVEEESFPTIAAKVRNVEGGKPTARTVANTYHDFSVKKGRRVFNYNRCGRKPWKMTEETKAFLEKRLRLLRKSGPCTAEVLRRDLADELDIVVDTSTIAKALKSLGYRWQSRSQKPRRQTARSECQHR